MSNKPVLRELVRLFLILFVLLAPAGCNLPLPPGAKAITTDQVVPDILEHTSQKYYTGWVESLSGARMATIGDEMVTITSRNNYAMFSGLPNARAMDYVLAQVRQWVPESQIEVDPYPYTDAERTYIWQNIIVTLPGRRQSEERVLLTAHLDSITYPEDSTMLAPGADDNASGTAALLEAVRLLRSYRFERTIQVIFFSGEELGLLGSQAYLKDHPSDGIVGVINLDMIAYDANSDRCMEFHVGGLPQSQAVGEALVTNIVRHGLDVKYDYITQGATDRSDHASFWQAGVGAVLISENWFDQGIAAGCQGADINPHYHDPGDTVDKLNLATGYEVLRLALATVADIAGPLGPSFHW
ncbi:MAG: M20/M25/M40 family metallo-hydrolase [Anaerolineae bacterium]|nr:M20/M25/M40 family metallo-hydrolase [Anaerolineae bacterium]